MHGVLTNKNSQLYIAQEIKNNDADSCKSYSKTCAKGYID